MPVFSWPHFLRSITNALYQDCKRLSPIRRLALECLEDRTLLTATSPGVTFSKIEVQPSNALTTNAFVDIPGLTTNAAVAGNYHVSAFTTLQTTTNATTEVGIRIVANGVPVDTRIITFPPNSNQLSLAAQAGLALTSGELVEVQATVFTGAAQFPTGNNSPQDLRLSQFNDIPGSGPGVTFSKVEVQPSNALTTNAFVDIPGLTTSTVTVCLWPL